MQNLNKTILMLSIMLFIGIAIGLLIAPFAQVRIRYWALIHAKHSDGWVKLKAASKLIDTPEGTDILYERLKSTNGAVRQSALCEIIGNPNEPSRITSLLGFVSDSEDRLLIIKSMDYTDQLKFLMGTLEIEKRDSPDPEIRKKASLILDHYRELEPPTIRPKPSGALRR